VSYGCRPGAIGGFSVVPKSSGEFLLQWRSLKAACGLHAPSAVMAPLNAGLNVGLYFRVFMFFFF
jgi:hypothetical protein